MGEWCTASAGEHCGTQLKVGGTMGDEIFPVDQMALSVVGWYFGMFGGTVGVRALMRSGGTVGG